jgi:hypothetical protein
VVAVIEKGAAAAAFVVAILSIIVSFLEWYSVSSDGSKKLNK